MFQASLKVKLVPSVKYSTFLKAFFSTYDDMQNISIKGKSYKISKTLKHSHNVIEVFKPFFRALERSWRKKKAEINLSFITTSVITPHDSDANTSIIGNKHVLFN